MKLICIKCPKGCEITIENNIITGNQCLRGEQYAKEELVAPKRILTALAKSKNGIVPVKTNMEIPKDEIENVLKEINSLYLDNVEIGQIVIKNCLNLGVDIVVTGLPYIKN